MRSDPSDPSFNLFADATTFVAERRDASNYICQLFGPQFPEIKNGFFNVHMTRGMIVQPHWHTNASEMVFMIQGSTITSVFNPFTQKVMSYQIGSGQVTMLPKGWFHWIVAMTDDVHLLTIFDQPTPDVVFGSDFLRFTPAEVVGRAYCVNPEAYAQAVSPIQQSTILGPPANCGAEKTQSDPAPLHQHIYYAGP